MRNHAKSQRPHICQADSNIGASSLNKSVDQSVRHHVPGMPVNFQPHGSEKIVDGTLHAEHPFFNGNEKKNFENHDYQ